MNAAPRLWTDVVSGAFGFAAFGLLSEAATPVGFGADEPVVTFWNAGEDFAAGVVFAAVVIFVAVVVVVVVFAAVEVAGGAVSFTCATADFPDAAGFWFDHVAVGFVSSATVPSDFADDDEDATTWRKNQPGFAPRGGDFGVTAATFGAGAAAFAGAVVAFSGVVFTAFAPLDITGGVTVVFAMR